MFPIQSDSIKFKKCDLENTKTLIGIDIGSSLINFLFLDKNNVHELNDANIDQITLQHAIFSHEDVESSLKWLKEKAYIPNDKTLNIHGTGVGCYKYKEAIEDIFGLECFPVEEEVSIKEGHKILFEKMDVEALKYPMTELHDYGGTNDYPPFLKVAKEMRVQLKKNRMERVENNNFPCLVCFCGSVLTFLYYDVNGVGQFIGNYELGGKTFLGVSKCLLDTNNYDEIMDLAKRGNRCRLDTQVIDVLDTAVVSPYGHIPYDVPILSFGKCMENNTGLEYHSKEDVAHAFMFLTTDLFRVNINSLCFSRNEKRIYFTGNTFLSEVFRKEMHMANKLNWFQLDLDYIILKSGFCTALGAMLFQNNKIIY